MITVQSIVAAPGAPSTARVRRYVRTVVGERVGDITVRIVGSAESRRLNRQFRGKDKSTNVLSFPYEKLPVSGDLVLCAPVVRREAREQGKPVGAHWAHLIVHGALHLRGYDHIKSKDAKRMEARERAILAGFGFPDPYLIPPLKRS